MRAGPSLADYPARSGSGGALFAETPNGLCADKNSLNLARSKATILLRQATRSDLSTLNNASPVEDSPWRARTEGGWPDASIALVLGAKYDRPMLKTFSILLAL